MGLFAKNLMKSLEKVVLVLTIVIALGAFIFAKTERTESAAEANGSDNSSLAFFQISPQPTRTFTPTPVAPTNTPLPPTPTNTPSPPPPTNTPPPPTPTNTPPPPTDTPPPPTPTDTPPPPTPTDTPPPPTPTDTPPPPTDTPPPPTPTDTPVPPTNTPVPNTPPMITLITGPPAPIPVGEKATIAVSFFDPDIGDSHSASIDWGDSSSSSLGGITSPFSADHIYNSPAVYTLFVTVTDSAGAFDSQPYEFIVVFDPDGGFVTGAGWIESNKGAYKPDPTLSGKATFAFVSKYKKGVNAPIGNTQFNFQAAGLNFSSSSYQWLIVTGNGEAKFKGTGTINGHVTDSGEPYHFMAWIADGRPDTLRIKIWWEEGITEYPIYDNGFDQPIGGGSIEIHKAKK